MSTLPEQFSAASKSQIEAQLGYFHDVTAKVVESARKVLQLNIDTARASVETSTQAMSQMLLVKDPRDLLALTTQSQNNFDSLMNYSRALLGIATGARAELPASPQAVPEPVPAAPVENVVETVVETAQPLAEEAPLPVAASPIAKAVKKVARPAPAKPAAAPFPSAVRSKLVVTGIKPVEASPPPAPVPGKPNAESKQAAPKSRKKK